jgi:VCBS repeat-containing protein
MSRIAKYFVLSSAGNNFTDFGLSHANISTTGESIFFVGGIDNADAIFARPGTIIDFTLSNVGVDKIYLSGNYLEYTFSRASSVMTLTRGSGTSLEQVKFVRDPSEGAPGSDLLVFADGTRNSFDIFENLRANTALPAMGSEKSTDPLILSTNINASIKAFAIGTQGTTFASPRAGISVQYVGGEATDTVYVSDGARIDATQLGGEIDRIFFRGNWADYTKTISGSVLTFSRTVQGVDEVVKVVGVSSGDPSDRDARDDQLFFADGSVSSGAARVALRTSLSVGLNSVEGRDLAQTTPGVGLSILKSQLDDVTSLDPSSNIVLIFPEAVSKGVSGNIYIINSGGPGYRGENVARDLVIPINSSQVTIPGGSGTKVVIDPAVDLDLANSYYLKIDAGTFVGNDSSRPSLAFDGVASLNFSTVTPGVTSGVFPKASDAVASVVMDPNGLTTTGRRWLDIEGVGNGTVQRSIDVSGSDVVLVAKDYNPEGAVARSSGLWTREFNLQVDGFGNGDLIYFDNQALAINDLTKTILIDQGNGYTTFQFPQEPGLIGGFLNIDFKDYAGGFERVEDIKATSSLNFTYEPVVSDGVVKPSSDTTPPTVLSPATFNIVENSSLVGNLLADEVSAWSVIGGADAALFVIDGSRLSFKSAPNFEARSTPYGVSVRATDSSNNTRDASLTITVTDANEAPVAVGTVGAQVALLNKLFSLALAGKFADPDAGTTSNGTLNYSITSGALPAGLSLNPATGSVSGTATSVLVAAPITVKATDGGSPGLSATQTFTIGSAGDLVVTGFSVTEASPTGSTAVGKAGDRLNFVLATSEAVSVNTSNGIPTATFSVGGVTVVAQYTAGSGSAGLTFVAEAPAGGSGTFQLTSVSLNGGLIAAADNASRALLTSVVGQTFTGYSLDNIPPSLTVPSPIKVNENAAAVVQVTASESVTFAALGTTGDSGLFTLTSGGVLSFKSSQGQNFEQTGRANTYSLPITVTDTAGNATTRTITVELQDVNEFPVSAVTDRNTATNAVMENSPVGTPVGYTASATDADGSNNTVSYKLLDSNGVSDYTGKELRIDATTGVVSVAGSIDYEALTPKALTFHVKATSADGSSSVTASPVSITILDDVNETVPIVLQSASVISPSTTSISGTTTPGAVVKVFLGTAAAASDSVTAGSNGVWSVPVSSLSGLVSGSNAVKFTATVGSTVGTLNQNFLYSGTPSWTQSALKVASIRGTVDQALSSDGKITHAEAISVLDSAIAAAKTASGASGAIGDTILADLRAISLRGDSVFTSQDLTGKESGYLSYVFDKVVNTSPANAFFTGGTVTRQALGNLNGNSPVSALEKLRDKWLLGLDLPDPRTEGDTANPAAVGASGEYRAFNGSLVIDGFGYTDVRQGSMGDCYLLAGAAGIAEASTYAKTTSDPKLSDYATAFERMFSANSGVPTWGVRFYDVFNKPHWVTVNNQLVVPVGSGTNVSPSYAKVPVAASTGKSELWVALLEKAYAQANETGIFERDNSSNAFFAIEGGWGTNLQQMLGGGTAFFPVDDRKTVSWTRGYFGLPASEVNTQLGTTTLEGIMNFGHPFYIGSGHSSQIGGKIAWTGGHAYTGFDPVRTNATNTNITIYNPWGPTGPSHVSPFEDNLGTIKNNAKLSLAFRVPTVPDWVTKYFDSASSQKAAAAKPVSSASVLQSTETSGSLLQSFLKIGAGVSTAYADNGTENDTADDRQGVFKLTGNETGVKVFLTPKPGVSADLSVHLQAISSATVDTFLAAVNAAKAVSNVKFVFQPSGAVDITGDPEAELGVSVALGLPSGATSGNIVFTPVKEAGEVGSAKVDDGFATEVVNTKQFPEAHSINIDTTTGAVMFMDSEGYWQVGKFGELKSSYVPLTHNVDGTVTKVNHDTFEASAKAAQFIFDSDGTTVLGFEVIAASNENPDDLFVLYFDSTGQLAGSEYLSPEEELEAEGEYLFDANESGSLGNEPFFLAEGIAGAPDLYADPYGDLVLLTGHSNGSPVYLPITIALVIDAGEPAETYPINLYDFEDGIEFTAVVKAPDSTTSDPKYLLYLQFGDDDVATVTVQKTGAILLDSEGEVLVGAPLTPQQEAELEKASGIDLGRDGDTAAESPLITGNAEDNTFDSRGDGTSDRYKDSTGDDTYLGGEGDDLLIGILSGEANFASRGVNVFYGDDGNDRFAGMGDGDIFLAGPGDKDSVWVDGARAAFEILLATPEQMALARAFDESVTAGYVIREIASGSIAAVFDAEMIEFAVGGFSGQLSSLAAPYTYVQ